MKILYVVTEPSPGMYPFAVNIINSMATIEQYEIHVIAVNSKKKSFSGKFKNSVKCIYISENTSLFRKAIDKLWFIDVIRVLNSERKEFKPDVIHFLTADFRLGVYSMLHSSKLKNFCYTVHDLHPHEREYKNFILWLIQKLMTFGCWLNRLNIPNLTTCSISQYEELKVLYPRKNIHFTHFPTLVTPEIANGEKNVPELKGIDQYILFFGSVDKYKGVNNLVQAYLKSSQLKNYKLVIAGNDKKQIVMKNSTNIININRYIKDDEIKDLFSKAKIVVYPYLSATMSGVLSIAFYFKKNVILSDIPFFKEFECENTFFFKNNNVDDLQKTLEVAIKKERDDSIIPYERFYSTKQLLQDYQLLYKSIVTHHDIYKR